MINVVKEDVSSWDYVGTSDDISIYKKYTDGSPVVMVKVYALIEGVSAETVYEVMSN